MQSLLFKTSVITLKLYFCSTIKWENFSSFHFFFSPSRKISSQMVNFWLCSRSNWVIKTATCCISPHSLSQCFLCISSCYSYQWAIPCFFFFFFSAILPCFNFLELIREILLPQSALFKALCYVKISNVIYNRRRTLFVQRKQNNPLQTDRYSCLLTGWI